MAGISHSPARRLAVARSGVLSVKCVAQGGKRAASLAGAATLSRQLASSRAGPTADTYRTADRQRRSDELCKSAAQEWARRQQEAADAEQMGCRYVSAIARSPRLNEMPFKPATPRSSSPLHEEPRVVELPEELEEIISPDEAAASVDTVTEAANAYNARKQKRELKRAQAGSLRGFRPRRTSSSARARAGVAASLPEIGSMAASTSDFPDTASAVIEALAGMRTTGRTKLSTKLQNLCCEVIQRFAGEDLQGRSHVAKAVYLAESALLEDSRPNMNKLAVQLQQQSGLPFEDLTSAATNYLGTAAKNFNPSSSSASFRTYFYTCMRSRMLEAIRTQKHVLVIPSRFSKSIKAVSTAQNKLRGQGLQATVKQLAAETGLRPCQVEHVLHHKRSSQISLEDSDYCEISLHERISAATSDSEGGAEPTDSVFCDFISEETSSMITSLLDNLSEREREVLEHRYGFGASDGEPLSAYATSKLLGCVRTTVTNTEARALKKLKSMPGFAELEEALLSGDHWEYMEDIL